MSNKSLEIFISDVVRDGVIARADVRRLQQDVFSNGIECRDEVDLLVALDRAVPVKDPAWNSFVIQAVVDYVVWSSRPTGYIDAETATWLIASLSSGRGPTDVAVAIAFDVVREAERADETLVAFVMTWAAGLHRAVAFEDALGCAIG